MISSAGGMSSPQDLEMFVVDVLRYDIEPLDSIMNLLNGVDPIGWSDVLGRSFTREEVLEALVLLVQRGWVGLAKESVEANELVPVDGAVDAQSLREGYWFVLQNAGRRVWEKWIPPEGGPRYSPGIATFEDSAAPT